MFSNSYKIINITVFVVLATFMLLVQSAYADTYEVRAQALTASFNNFCRQVDTEKVKTSSRYNVKAYMKARLLQREAGLRLKACKGNLQCRYDVKRNSIKKMHASPELRKAGYFGWSANTLEAVKAEAAKYGFVE